MMEGIVIRKYKREDRDSIRGIAYDTSFMGDSAEAFFEDKEILADILTLYFTDYEPDSCFVAEKNGVVVGYVMGAKDISGLRRVFLCKIFPKLLAKAVTHNVIFQRKAKTFIVKAVISFFKGEIQLQYFNKLYPANLHIDIAKDFRNQWVGSELLNTYFNYLIGQGIPGVHLATRSDKAAHFFEKEDFVLLKKGKRSYFRHILHRDVPSYFYIKKLSTKK